MPTWRMRPVMTESSAQLRQRAFHLVVESRNIDSTQQQSWLEEQLAIAPELQDEVRPMLEVDRGEFTLFDQSRVPAVDPVPDQRVGSRIGRFLLEEKIAAGGMGVVYRALPDWRGARPVALKLIKRGMES